MTPSTSPTDALTIEQITDLIELAGMRDDGIAAFGLNDADRKTLVKFLRATLKPTTRNNDTDPNLIWHGTTAYNPHEYMIVGRKPVPNGEGINYAVLHDFAERVGVSYNDLCATVRQALSTGAARDGVKQPADDGLLHDRSCILDEPKATRSVPYPTPPAPEEIPGLDETLAKQSDDVKAENNGKSEVTLNDVERIIRLYVPKKQDRLHIIGAVKALFAQTKAVDVEAIVAVLGRYPTLNDDTVWDAAEAVANVVRKGA